MKDVDIAKYDMNSGVLSEAEQEAYAIRSHRNQLSQKELQLFDMFDSLATAILVGFIAIIMLCLVCRKRIKKPALEPSSVFMQSFVEDGISSTKETAGVSTLSQKAPSHKRQPLNDEDDSDYGGELELVWSQFFHYVQKLALNKSNRHYLITDRINCAIIIVAFDKQINNKNIKL